MISVRFFLNHVSVLTQQTYLLFHTVCHRVLHQVLEGTKKNKKKTVVTKFLRYAYNNHDMFTSLYVLVTVICSCLVAFVNQKFQNAIKEQLALEELLSHNFIISTQFACSADIDWHTNTITCFLLSNEH